MSPKKLQEELKEKLIENHISIDQLSKVNLDGLIFNATRRYDRYEMYPPGDNFNNRLIKWINNFDLADRSKALGLIESLSYISRFELMALAEIVLDFASSISWASVINNYNSIYSGKKSFYDSFKNEIKRNIFIAITDDIGLDYFRRKGRNRFPQLEKENFVEYYKLDRKDIDKIDKKIKVNYNLKKRFLLIDQFTGSGTSALRFKHEGEGKAGKLPTFFERWRPTIAGSKVYYVPLIAFSFVHSVLKERLIKVAGSATGILDVEISPIQIIPSSKWIFKDDGVLDKSVLTLLEKYYNRFQEDNHTIKGGGCLFGLGAMGLSLVIGMNCPNNSFSIIWHDSDGWHPLFPRVLHHRPSGSLPITITPKNQKETLENNLKRKLSDTFFSEYSAVEIREIIPEIDMAASIVPSNPLYPNLRKLNEVEWLSIDVNYSNDSIKKFSTKIMGEIQKKQFALELHVNSNEQSSSSTNEPNPVVKDMDIQWKPKLIVPFVSVYGPLFSPSSIFSIKDVIIIPAIMFHLSGSYSIDSLLSKQSEYIDAWKVRTENFLYLPIESPAVSFRRAASLLKSWHDSNELSYSDMCLLPSCDSTSLLVTSALSSTLKVKFYIPNQTDLYLHNLDKNLILFKKSEAST